MSYTQFLWKFINCFARQNLNNHAHVLCLLGPLWRVYKGFFKIPLFSSSSVFLKVLNPPSGVENSNVKNPLLWYIQARFGLKSPDLWYYMFSAILSIFDTFWDFKPNLDTKDVHIINLHVKTQLLINNIWILNSRKWIDDHLEDKTGGKQWNFENSFICTS